MITSTPELKAAVGGAVNASFVFSAVAHAVPTIMQEKLEPVFGEDLFQLIQDETDTTTALYQVRKHCVTALAWLLLSDYADVGAVQLNTAGIMRIETPDAKSAYKYQEQRYRTAVRIKGHNFIEKALYFLHTHVDELTPTQTDIYTDSPAEGLTCGNLVCFSRNIEEEHGMRTDWLTFLSLKPLLRQLEEVAIVPLLGQTTYDILMERVRDGEISSTRKHFGNDAWDHLAYKLRNALVLAAVADAQRRYMVTVADGRVTLRQEFGESADSNNTVPGANLSSISHEHLREFKDLALNAACQYLEANRATFTDYATDNPIDGDATETYGVTDHGAIVSF